MEEVEEVEIDGDEESIEELEAYAADVEVDVATTPRNDKTKLYEQLLSLQRVDKARASRKTTNKP